VPAFDSTGACFPAEPLGGPDSVLELRQLIRRMASENPMWGAPRIHGELLKLGFAVSERTVSRCLARMGPRGDAGKRWLTFLKNHREVMAAMDFFTVPTATFRVLYGFFVIGHGRRRRILQLQCHGASHEPVDRATIARGFSGRQRTSLLDP
jgi:HTH-like domain